MAGAATLKIDVLADTAKAARSLDSIDRKLTGFGSKAGTALKGLAAGAAFTGITVLAGKSLKEASEAQKVARITDQLIKSTGGAAKVSAGHVADLATKLSQTTGVDDELIQANSNLLLTFKNVRNEGTGLSAVFDRANKAALDLAAAGFGDSAGNAKLLGKALNDPIAGLAKLGKAGVTFTDAQKEQVKALVESNDILGAQNVLLGELESQVGGAAAAGATGFEKFQTTLNNVLEALGTALLPIVDELLPIFADLLKSLVPIVKPIIAVVASVAKSLLTALKPALPPITKALEELGEALAEGLGEALVALAPIVPPLARALVSLVLAITPLIPVLADIIRLVAPILEQLAKLIELLAEVVKWIVEHVIDALRKLGKPLEAVRGFFGDLLDKVRPLVSWLGDHMKPVLIALAVVAFGPLVIVGLALKEVFEFLIARAAELVGWIARHLSPAVDQLRAMLEPVVSFARQLWGWLVALATWIADHVIGALQGLWEKLGPVRDVIGTIVGFLADMISKLQTAIGLARDLASKLLDLAPNTPSSPVAPGVPGEPPIGGPREELSFSPTGTRELTRGIAAATTSALRTAAATPVTINVTATDRTTARTIGREIVRSISAYEQANTARWRTAPV